jgi:hypothetical protein
MALLDMYKAPVALDHFKSLASEETRDSRDPSDGRLVIAFNGEGRIRLQQTRRALRERGVYISKLHVGKQQMKDLLDWDAAFQHVVVQSELGYQWTTKSGF